MAGYESIGDVVDTVSFLHDMTHKVSGDVLDSIFNCVLCGYKNSSEYSYVVKAIKSMYRHGYSGPVFWQKVDNKTSDVMYSVSRMLEHGVNIDQFISLVSSGVSGYQLAYAASAMEVGSPVEDFLVDMRWVPSQFQVLLSNNIKIHTLLNKGVKVFDYISDSMTAAEIQAKIYELINVDNKCNRLGKLFRSAQGD